MTGLRHTFKTDNTKAKLDFTAKMYELINNEYKGDKNLYDVVDYYAGNPGGNSFLTLARVVSLAFGSVSDSTLEKCIEWIDSALDKEKSMSNIEHSDNYNHNEQIQGIAKEFQQIKTQTDQMMGNSISIANDVNIIKINQDEQTEYLESVDLVEIIDLGEDMDKDPSLITDVDLSQKQDNLVCVFCESKNILVVSETEGFCYDCNKKFLIQKRKNV